MQSALDRFEAKFIPEPNSGCWLWTAYCNSNGYGQFSLNGRQGFAHRASYEMYVGPIPEGLELDHLCRVRCCVNPQHLEPVTRRVNMERGEIILRRKLQNLTVTHCPSGHPYSGDNLSIQSGARVCKTCKREKKRVRDRRTAEAEGRELLPHVSVRTHCPQGHPYAGDNLIITKKTGQRVCKTCARRRALAHYHKSKKPRG